MPTHVLVLGAGMMGGSLAQALARLPQYNVTLEQPQVTGFPCSRHHYNGTSWAQGAHISPFDIVVFALPCSAILSQLATTDRFKNVKAFTDISSAKGNLLQQLASLPSNTSNFILSHPMCGSEKKGAAYANPDIFNTRNCVLVSSTSPAFELISRMWTDLGMRLTEIPTADFHDQIMASVSHVEHVIAFSLALHVQKHAPHPQFFGNSVHDMTRISNASPVMWSEVLLTNSSHTLAALDSVIANLQDFRQALASDDYHALRHLIQDANQAAAAINQSRLQ